MLPRRLLAWMFALTLLFGQATAFAHALTHLKTHDVAPPDQTCEVCVAQANLGSAAAAKVFSLPVAVCRDVARPAAVLPFVTVRPTRAQARAPPTPV